MAKDKVVEAHAKYGEIFRITLLRNYQFMVSSPKLYETILGSTTHYLKKSEIYDFLRPWLKDGLIVSDGHHWYNHRKIITPTFHFNILEQFVEVFDRQSRIMVDKLKMRCDGIVVDVVDYVQAAALDIISETAMGITIDAQNGMEMEFVKAMDE